MTQNGAALIATGMPARYVGTVRAEAAYKIGREQSRRGWPAIEPQTWNRIEIEAYRAGRRIGGELRRSGASGHPI